mgnify:CR=1 FL=1
MPISTLLALFACLIGGGMGLYGLFRPRWIAYITRLEATAPEGRSEFRASFAGLFFALHVLAAFALIGDYPGAAVSAATVGFGWLGASFGRVLSFIFDGAFTRLNLFNVIMELTQAALLLAPILALH